MNLKICGLNAEIKNVSFSSLTFKTPHILSTETIAEYDLSQNQNLIPVEVSGSNVSTSNKLHDDNYTTYEYNTGGCTLIYDYGLNFRA